MKRTPINRKTKLTAKKPAKRGGKMTERKRLDMLFSKWIRYSRVGKDGLAHCYTCPHKDDPKKMQNGHFVPRQYLATRYDEVNCQIQCYACNQLYNGQPSAFAARLEREFGKGTVERLESKRQLITKNFDYGYWIQVYKEKLTDLGV